MLDIRWMRENRAALAEAMQKLNDPDAPWAIALELDERRRQILTRVSTRRVGIVVTRSVFVYAVGPM